MALRSITSASPDRSSGANERLDQVRSRFEKCPERLWQKMPEPQRVGPAHRTRFTSRLNVTGERMDDFTKRQVGLPRSCLRVAVPDSGHEIFVFVARSSHKLTKQHGLAAPWLAGNEYELTRARPGPRELFGQTSTLGIATDKE